MRALYSNGGVVARRYGSAANSAFSQVLQPLYFGIPDGVTVESVDVRWPGALEDERYRVLDTDRVVVLERR